MMTLKTLAQVSLAQLVQRDAQHTTILTVNNRLARRVVQELARAPIQMTQVSEMPAVLPFTGWVAQQLMQAGFHPAWDPHAILLDNFGSQLLWAQVIDEVETAAPLLDTQQAASAAQQADKLLDEWAIDVDSDSATEEYTRFMQWREHYQDRLQSLNALDANAAIDRVIEGIAGGLQVPRHLVLAGFSELTPRLSRLLEALVTRDVSVSVLEQDVSTQAQLSRVMSETAQTEWDAAAHWARQQLKQNPLGRFAIVAVSLEADAAFARRTLSRVLAPEFAYNVAVARPLSEWQAGRAVLAWLRTFVLMKERGRASTSDLGAALLSGYCAGDLNELGARANVDARWRHDQITDLNLKAWSKAIEPLEQVSPAWHLAWQAWADLPREDTLQFWSFTFRQSLATLGFPGRTRQSSTIYQVVEAVDQAFERLEALSPLFERITASEALNIFKRLLRAIAFQPQRDPSARLDVLGMLEAEGGRWEGVWVLGLTDEVLPALAKPNPFIPLPALRRAGSPRATPEREREWAGQMFSQLCVLAPVVVVSSAMHEGERGLRPSPLIQKISLIDQAPNAADRRGVITELALIEDSQAPTLGVDEKVGGGVALLETQARNPQWAFMRYRLGARGLPAYSTMPSTGIRGEFLHEVMENIWKALRSQVALKEACSTGALEPLITHTVEMAAEKRLWSLSPPLRALEATRARRIVLLWLMIETERQPFEVVDIEERYELSMAGLTLQIRLDRMDMLEDGGRILIDYKSGKNLSNVVTDWQRDRPTQLQLPAYAAVLAQRGAIESIVGLFLVHLHAKAHEPLGLLRDGIGLEGPKLWQDAQYDDVDWAASMQRLNLEVTQLAAEFSAGLAINQSWSKNDLEYCDVPALLRQYDNDAQLSQDEDGSDESEVEGSNDE